MRAVIRNVLLAGVVLGGASSAQAAEIPVTTNLDTVANDGLCSLREAYSSARGLPSEGCPAGSVSGTDVIRLGAGTFRLSRTGNDDLNQTGDLDTGPTNAVRIVGAGPAATTIDANEIDRAFDVFATATLSLEDLAIIRGIAPTEAAGGAIKNLGTLNVTRVAFDSNVAGDADVEPGAPGGAIFSAGSASRVTVVDSTFHANRGGRGFSGGDYTGGSGGAIAMDDGVLSVSGSTFSENRAGFGPRGGDGGSGGAIAIAAGSATVVNSTFASNAAGDAGTSDITGLPGRGGSSGAIHVSGGSALVTFSTFLGNVRGNTSPFANGITGAFVGSSILADPLPACGQVTPSATNLVAPGEPSCGAGLAGAHALGLLQPNGGATPTLVPGAGSAALGAAAGCPATDQRGQPRPAVGCDLGAVEVPAPPPGAPGGAGAPSGAAAPVAAKRVLSPSTLASLRRITGVTLSRTAFRTYGRTKGTTLGVRLNAASSVILTVTKPATGRRSKGRCVAPTRALLGKPRCTRQVPLAGRITKVGRAGLNPIAFSGKLRGRALAPGAYTFVLTLPKLGAAKPVVATKAFRVLS